MADKYNAELEKVLVNYGNLNYRLKQGTGEQTQHELMLEAKAKLSALLRRVEVEGRMDELDLLDEEMSEIDGIRDWNYIERRLKELQALLPRSPQEGGGDASS